MKRSKGPTTRRAQIQRLYQSYASGLPTLPASKLLEFLHKEQYELAASEETAESLIDRYEIEETARESRSMTFEGFFRYMESKDCSVFDRTHSSVYQDMDQPLSSYFISSSHNTYLTGDQLVGKSRLDAYVRALRRGCRCLEIDCWDGQDLEPIVYHGYTLTTKILFKDVIATVGEHAFEVSAYPVILSLENHCCQKQQEVMAHYLVSILGDKLLTAPLDGSNTGELPSPNDLKYKILIKNKKIKRQTEDTVAGAEERREELEEEEEDEEEEDEEEEENAEEVEEDEEEDVKETEEEEEEEEDDCGNKLKVWLKKAGSVKKKQKKKKKKKVMVAAAMSDLVLYTSSVKFVSFGHSRDNQHSYENTSMSETKAHKLAKASGADFVLHTQRFLSRIYPAGSRTSSSNYNPQEFWNVGAQLVALNFQSRGLSMDLNEGRFQDNGGCGYVLKPAVLMSSQRGFDPGCSRPGLKPVRLLLKVIGASTLPGLRSSKPLDPFVRVEIHGIGADFCRKSTRTVKNNSLNPHWDADMNFSIEVPELCLVRFCVRHQSSLLSSDFVAQYTLPFTSLKKGYRWVPLLGRDGCSLDPASLSVFVWYS